LFIDNHSTKSAFLKGNSLAGFSYFSDVGNKLVTQARNGFYVALTNLTFF